MFDLMETKRKPLSSFLFPGGPVASFTIQLLGTFFFLSYFFRIYIHINKLCLKSCVVNAV